jgi:hypothetical protein
MSWTKKMGCLVSGTGLMVLLAGNSLPAGEPKIIEGPVMAINVAQGFIVVNEVRVYIGSGPEDTAQRPVEIKSLKKGQWVSLAVERGKDNRLWAAEIIRIDKTAISPQKTQGPVLEPSLTDGTDRADKEPPSAQTGE